MLKRKLKTVIAIVLAVSISCLTVTGVLAQDEYSDKISESLRLRMETAADDEIIGENYIWEESLWVYLDSPDLSSVPAMVTDKIGTEEDYLSNGGTKKEWDQLYQMTRYSIEYDIKSKNIDEIAGSTGVGRTKFRHVDVDGVVQVYITKGEIKRLVKSDKVKKIELLGYRQWPEEVLVEYHYTSGYALDILQACVGLSSAVISTVICDVDGDENITCIDALLVLQATVGKIKLYWPMYYPVPSVILP